MYHVSIIIKFRAILFSGVFNYFSSCYKSYNCFLPIVAHSPHGQFQSVPFPRLPRGRYMSPYQRMSRTQSPSSWDGSIPNHRSPGSPPRRPYLRQLPAIYNHPNEPSSRPASEASHRSMIHKRSVDHKVTRHGQLLSRIRRCCRPATGQNPVSYTRSKWH